jgi:4'-phosphopantetheinyl transferase
VEGADAAVSVSYVQGWAVAVAAPGLERVGLDAVPTDAGGLERVLPRLAPPGPDDLESPAPEAWADAGGSSAAPARTWARVEAVLKADGRGLTVDARRVAVQGHGDTWVARILPSASRGPSPAEGLPREWRGWDLDGPTNVVLAVAVESASGL